MEELAAPLRAALVRSLGRFYLGESSEGRIAKEAARSSDPALDGPLRESIALYVREEGRHGTRDRQQLSGRSGRRCRRGTGARASSVAGGACSGSARR